MNAAEPIPANVITQLLRAMQQGDEQAKHELFRLVYPALAEMAHALLRPSDRAAQWIRPSDLLQSAVVRLLKPVAPLTTETPDARYWLEQNPVENRAQFFAVIGRVMRQVIVDEIRSRYGRGSQERVFVSLTGVKDLTINPKIDWVELDEVLCRLEKDYPRAARVIELRVLWGMTIEETAAALDVAVATANSDFRYGKAFITKELKDAPKP